MMRILLANDGFGDEGGVQRYLDAVVGGLLARGHQVAIVHRDPIGPPDRAPLPTEIRIKLVIPCLAVGNCDEERCKERNGPDRSSMRHGRPPFDLIGGA